MKVDLVLTAEAGSAVFAAVLCLHPGRT